MQLELAEPVSPQDRLHQVVDLYATNGSFAATADQLGLHKEQVRRVIKSPQGSFHLEQLLRDRARTRALKLAALADRTIAEFDIALTNGNERILNSRKDGDPITVFLRPDIKDLTGALAWMTHHMQQIADTLSAVDVTSHDVSHEARSQNLASLKELVAQEERRLSLDAERQAAAPPVVDVASPSPWQRGSFGNAASSPDTLKFNASDTHSIHRHRKPSPQQQTLMSSRASDAREQGLSSSADAQSSSAADAVATLMHAGDTGSRNQPPARPAARETSPENFSAPGSSANEEVVDWDDMEE